MKALKETHSRFRPSGYGEILRVGLPLVAGMGSSTLMQFTDRLFLARYSVDAIAAATPAALVSMTSLLIVMGVTSYCSVIIAQYFGSGAYDRIGSALWQGLWSAIIGGLFMALLYFAAPFIFSLSGHADRIQVLEVSYFRSLNVGSVFPLLANCLGTFFSGRAQTRQVMIANMLGAVLNIPLDYVLIYGAFGFAGFGIVGAGIATVLGSVFIAIFLAKLVFTRENEERYRVRSGWRFQPEMFWRLLRFGMPNSVNYFMEMLLMSWFVFEVGALGTNELAASNIAFSLNSLVFMPMMGMSMAVAALAGQAMGAGNPAKAEDVTWKALKLTLGYMIPIAIIFVTIPGFLMDIFAPSDLEGAAFAPVRSVGIILLYYIALYSLVDACNLIFLGALKGVGDTRGIMYIILFCAVTCMLVPIIAIKKVFTPSVNAYWVAFSVYVMLMAGLTLTRFRMRKWVKIRVVETAKPVNEAGN